jgi:hypothetical protein
MGINHFQETKFENELSGKAKLKATRMNGRQSEFFSARGFWFFFPEKKNKYPSGNETIFM